MSLGGVANHIKAFRLRLLKDQRKLLLKATQWGEQVIKVYTHHIMPLSNAPCQNITVLCGQNYQSQGIHMIQTVPIKSY